MEQIQERKPGGTKVGVIKAPVYELRVRELKQELHFFWN